MCCKIMPRRCHMLLVTKKDAFLVSSCILASADTKQSAVLYSGPEECKTSWCLVVIVILCFVQPNATGELKTKPTQNAVRQLRELGLSADFVSTFAFIFMWCLSPATTIHKTLHWERPNYWKIGHLNKNVCVCVSPSAYIMVYNHIVYSEVKKGNILL